MAIDSQGVLYGTTFYGGGSNLGTAFSVTPPASPGGPWTEQVIHRFSGGLDGANPSGGLLLGIRSSGQTVLYGTALDGPNNGGLVYSLTSPEQAGGVWTKAVVYAFPKDYRFYRGPLVWGSHGVLYGSTAGGGAQHSGSVYALIPPASAGSPWTFRNLYNFAAGFTSPTGNLPYWGEILAELCLSSSAKCNSRVTSSRGQLNRHHHNQPPAAQAAY